MVYKQNFVIAIRHNGRILREDGENVTLPFGAEYSLRLKNLDSRRAVVSVSIDGEDVLDNSRIIVNGYSTVDLEGFMDGMSVTRKFKFIKKIKEISEYRGDREDDGCIRVEVWFEKKYETTWTTWDQNQKWDFNPPNREWHINDYTYYNTPTTMYGNSEVMGSNTPTTMYSNTNSEQVTYSCTFDDTIRDDEKGITAKGSDCNQNFINGYTNELEFSSTVLTLWLKGSTNKKIYLLIRC